VKLSIPAHHFREAALWTAKIAPARPAAPVLGMLTITTHGDSTAILAASDMQTWGTHSVPAVVHSGGTVAVSARLLVDVVKAMPGDGTVDMVAEDGGSLLVTCGRAKASLPVLSGTGDQMPAAPEASPFEHEISGEALARALSVSERICGGRDVYPDLAMVRLDPQPDGLGTAASDRYCLLVTTVPWATDQVAEAYPPVHLPPASARTIAALADTAGTVGLAFPTDQHADVFAAETPNRRVVTRLADGSRYPGVTKFLTQTGTPRVVTVDGHALASLVKRVGMLGEVTTDKGKVHARHVRLMVGAETVEVTAGGWDESDRAGITDYIDAEHGEEWDTDPWPLTVDAQLLAAVLDGLPDGAVRLTMTGPAKPVTARSVEYPDAATALVMPVRTPARP
jgi:DNA polymerase III sliding clamp (beta) subunit (PCNA family)